MVGGEADASAGDQPIARAHEPRFDRRLRDHVPLRVDAGAIPPRYAGERGSGERVHGLGVRR